MKRLTLTLTAGVFISALLAFSAALNFFGGEYFLASGSLIGSGIVAGVTTLVVAK